MPEFEYAPAQTIAARIRSDYFPGDRVVREGAVEDFTNLEVDDDVGDKGELVLDEDGDWQLRTGRDQREAEDTATLRPAREEDDGSEDADASGMVPDLSPPPVLKPDWVDRLSILADRVHRYLDKRRAKRERAARAARREAVAAHDAKQAEGGKSGSVSEARKEGAGSGSPRNSRGNPSGVGGRKPRGRKPSETGGNNHQGGGSATGKPRNRDQGGNRSRKAPQGAGGAGGAKASADVGNAKSAGNRSSAGRRRRNGPKRNGPGGPGGGASGRRSKASGPESNED